MINDAKTEFLVIGTQQQLSKLTISNIRVGDVTISSSIHVRNLGSWFDSRLCMDKHITSTCSASFYHIHNIRKISKYLSRDALVILIHAFITSRLDYCNSLFYGLPDSQLIKLQRVQNTAARIVYGASRRSHITPILRQLHWLPIYFRIQFKILLLTFKALHNLAPRYITDLLSIKTHSHYSLRSNTNWQRCN